VSQWLKTGFGLVIGFINHLRVVTTNNYYTITDLHTTKHSTLLSSIYLHKSSRIYNTVSLNHTLPISLSYSTHKIFKSHVKSSQADFLYSSVLLVPIHSELTAHGSRYIAAERTWTYLLLLRHYNTRTVFVFSTPPFPFVLSWTVIFQSGTFIFLMSALTSSSQRVFGPSTGLAPNGFHEYRFLTELLGYIRSTWPIHECLCTYKIDYIFVVD
jgi:hypothetical protein